MADTGWKNLTSFSSVAPGDNAWTNASNASASDDSDAYVVLPTGENSEYLKCTGISGIAAALPTDATPTGIAIRIERSRSSGGAKVRDLAIRLTKSGNIIGTNKASGDDWPTSDAYAEYGGDGDLWTLIVTRSDLVDSTYGLAVRAEQWGASGSPVAYIDHVQFKVFYYTGSLVTPSPISFSLSPASTSIAASKSVSPDPVSFSLSPAAPTATPHKTATPSPVAFSFSIPDPAIASGGLVTPSSLTFTMAVAAPSVKVDKPVTPSPVAFSLSPTAPSASLNKTVTPNPVTFTIAPTAPSIVATKTVTPLPVGFAFTVMNPGITIGPTVDAGKHIDHIVDLDYTMRPTVIEGGAAITTYLWEVVDSPLGSTVTFSATDVESPVVSFDTVGDYILRLTVTDANGNDGDDTVTASIYLSLGIDPLYRSLPRLFV